MEPLSWTGALGTYLNPALGIAFFCLIASSLIQFVLNFTAEPMRMQANADGTLMKRGGFLGKFEQTTKLFLFALIAVILSYIILGALVPYGSAGIIGAMSKQFIPVWLCLVALFAVSITFKRRLGLYGKLFDSTIGMIGFGLVMFWVFTALLAGVFDMLATFDPLQQVSGLKNKTPGVVVPEGTEGRVPHYLLGGDNLARDIFSRVIHGSTIVIAIAPLATVFAFMVGITLGLPAGFYTGAAIEWGKLGAIVVAFCFAVLSIAVFIISGFKVGFIFTLAELVLFYLLLRTKLDTVLSFCANLILAFPVILLFYLLVTPEIVATGIPTYMAMFLFIFPLIFFGVLLNSRYHTQPAKRGPILAIVLGVLGWLYLSLINQSGTPVNFLPGWFDLFDINSGILVVFVSVVFVNSPTVFRIVRGLALDLRTRDYVAAAQTRGEGSWYVMLWEILPNARGPLIVDFCLRIGYTTILLGTLGFFGLGLPPESPDWGSTINEGRKLLLIFVHPALPPAIALLSLVLGLNLLADGLREESLKD